MNTPGRRNNKCENCELCYRNSPEEFWGKNEG